MDTSGIIAGAAAVSALLGIIKLLGYRRPMPKEALHHQSGLFPNGDKEKIIAAIEELKIENRLRRTETLEARAELQKTHELLQDISLRLERANI